MITSITYQFSINKKFIVKNEKQEAKIYGEYNTHELEATIEDSIENMQALHALISELNQDLTTTLIAEKCEIYAGRTPRINVLTKSKRSYSLLGLTIHEEDTKN